MIRFTILVAFIFWITACGSNQVDLPQPSPVASQDKKEKILDELKRDSYRARSAIPTNQGRYEGSLWNDEASWGNLLRDHRARFRGDLVKITNLEDVISVAKPKEPRPIQTPLAAAGEEAAGQATQVLDAVTGMSKAEEEQNQVLSSLRSISAYVQSVLPNGNMVIVGEKVDYRQQNTVRYVTTVKGIIRPVDVNEANEVQAIKLARFEPKIKRQMLARSLQSLSPVIGQKKAGLLDRLSHIATPSSGNRTNPVNTN
jgi:flagellar basal body L-ring protein FlgH